MSNNNKDVIFIFIALAACLIPFVSAQNTTQQQQQPYYAASFSPSIAIIIVVLITALFFLGFFSIYVRHCSSDPSARTSVRPVTGRTGRSNRRGLDVDILQTFPTFPYSQVKHLKIGKGALECAVCLNEFEDDETLRLLPKCDHVFHPDCIDAWLASHTTCPVCRANLDAEPVTVEPLSEPGLVNDNQPAVAGPGSLSIGVAEEEEVEISQVGESLNRGRSMRSSKSFKSLIWSKFSRSHSTGHSLVQPGENMDRFTLRLPEQVRREIMTRALDRTTSLLVLPRETSSRRGYRANGGGEGSSRGGKSYRRLGSLDRPDRWVFSMAPPFLTRESSMKSPKDKPANSAEGTSSRRFSLIGRLSFNRFGGSKRSDPGLVANDLSRPPLPV